MIRRAWKILLISAVVTMAFLSWFVSPASATLGDDPVGEIASGARLPGDPYYDQFALDLQDVSKIPVPGDWTAIDAMDNAASAGAATQAAQTDSKFLWSRAAARVVPSRATFMAAGRAIAIRAGVYSLAYDLEGTAIRHYRLEWNLFGGCVQYCSQWAPTSVGNDVSGSDWKRIGTANMGWTTTAGPAADNAYPCGASPPTTVNVGCDVEAEVFEFTRNNGGTTGVTTNGFYNTDIWCSVSSSAAQSWDSSRTCWNPAAQFTSVQSANYNYAWQLSKAAIEAGAHLQETGPNNYSNGQQGTMGIYYTAQEWQDRSSLPDDAGGGKQPGDVTVNFTRPTITNTDIRNGAAACTGVCKRWMDCQLAPTSKFCTDPSQTATVPTVTPTTVTGTISTFSPFVIPEPQPTQTYGDYLEELRAKGWLGTATVNVALSNSSLTGPNGVQAVSNTTTGTGPNVIGSWPVNALKITTANDAVTLSVNSPSAAIVNPPDSGDAIDWTPIESISFGSRFPFGIPTWIENFFSGVSFSGSCTTLSFNKPAALGGGAQTIPFCSTEWENTYRPIVFPIIETLMTIAGVVFLAGKLTGYGDSDQDGG